MINTFKIVETEGIKAYTLIYVAADVVHAENFDFLEQAQTRQNQLQDMGVSVQFFLNLKQAEQAFVSETSKTML